MKEPQPALRMPDGLWLRGCEARRTFYVFRKPGSRRGGICQKALQYDLVLVPADSFGCPGYFRMAYCIDTEKVVRSLDALERFVKTEYPDR